MNTQPEANLELTEALEQQHKEFMRALQEVYRQLKEVKEEQKKNVEQLELVIKQFKYGNGIHTTRKEGDITTENN